MGEELGEQEPSIWRQNLHFNVTDGASQSNLYLSLLIWDESN